MTDFIEETEYLETETEEESSGISEGEFEEVSCEVSEVSEVSETSETNMTEGVDEPTSEELEAIKRKELITKVKIIAFDSLGKDPLTNGSRLSQKEKLKVINKMQDILLLSEECITDLFNEIVREKLFDSDRDYTEFPIYN
jgi:hypothetical protein